MKNKQSTTYKLLAKDHKSQRKINDNPASKITDDLFQEGPPDSMIAQASLRLEETLIAAKEKVIIYGSLEHSTVATLYLAMRNNRVIGIDFEITEHVFTTKIEKQFDAPVYFDPDKTKIAVEQVRNYLDGVRTDFDLPLDISILTDFQQQVLRATQKIPRGRIATYMEIARRIDKPKAVRAVGQALGRNPIPIVIPCHRVIASNGSLGGYSGGGGLETKAKLLQLEGALLAGM